MEIAASHNGEPHAGSFKTKPAPTRRSCKPSVGPIFREMHPSKPHRHPAFQEGTLSRCQGPKAAITSSHTGVNTEAVLHICLNYSAIEKNEKTPFEGTWKDPEMIMVCQVNHTDRQKWNRVLFIGGIEKYNQLKLISKHSLTPSYTANCKLIKFKTDPGGGGRGAKITEEAGTQQSMRRHRLMARETHRHSEQVRAGQNQQVRSTPSAATGE